MLKVVYITSSSYSGSTLLSFLLNTHPYIFTVSEMDGWNYGENEKFECSCGKTISECPFFHSIAEAFKDNNLPFNPRNFGTAYRLVRSDRFNRYLTGALPFAISSTLVERMRDSIVTSIPSFTKTLAEQDSANLTFIRTALIYNKSRVFVDACKDPYRLRHLCRINDLDVSILYLIRDLRGVVLSNLDLKKPGWDVTKITRMWIRQQMNILRILREYPSVMTIYYENLCDKVDETLAAIHRFIGLRPYPPPENFKTVEHHIIGNVMRLSNASKIVKNTRWESELSDEDLEAIFSTADKFIKSNRDPQLSEIIKHYLYE